MVYCMIYFLIHKKNLHVLCFSLLLQMQATFTIPGITRLPFYAAYVYTTQPPTVSDSKILW